MVKDKHMYLGLFVIACLSFSVFYYTFYFQVWQPSNSHWVSDIPTHASAIEKFSKNGNFPIYSLWYRLVNITSGFSVNSKIIAYTSIYLLIFSMCLKYIITYSLLKSEHVKIALTFLIAISLNIAMPIISFYKNPVTANQLFLNNFHVYLGNISPNQWHNSTLIFAMPFNLLLFYFSVKHIHSNQLRDFWIMSILSIISILCKPNYALVFLPIFCSYLLLLNYKEKQLLLGIVKTALIALPSIILLLLQWYFTFKHNNTELSPVKTIFAPFIVWGTYSPHIFISLILSIAFPLTTVSFYFKKMDSYWLISWLVFIFSLIIFSLLAEYPAYAAGNYGWGAIAANYILFLFSMRVLLVQPFNWKSKIAFAVFGLHVLSGLFSLSYFFVYQTALIL